ncbi:MAG: endonuclease/exonuclease/phosphatase family protein [Bacteroidales bacterium]|nr:endonuclease/exonuclease/phosphatase family protein [Bacteroidales bacterium]
MLILAFLCFSNFVFTQQSVTLMTYNLLKFSENSSDRLPCFKTVLDSLQPDILIVQEIFSQGAIDLFHSNALDTSYQKGIFIDGPDSDNGVFYKHDRFTFVSNTPIPTALRNISEFKLVFQPTGDTLRIYSVHLKASSGSASETQRLQEVMALRNITNSLPAGSNFVVCGDFNMYKSSEPAYQALIYNNQESEGHFIDPISLTGTWNKAEHARFHTQSTRTRQFGGGASGGLDDRFDMILFSSAIEQPGGVHYMPNSTWAVGNDGFHYNDSVNKQPNSSVSQVLADALHCASDHLPVIARFFFGGTVINLSVSLEEGWNSISTFFEPYNTEIPFIVAPLGANFIALHDIEGLVYPEGGTNSIENWNYHLGYALKVSESATLIIQGYLPDNAWVQINEGWNMIPVLSDSAKQIEDVFGQNLVHVEMIKEVAGTNVFWPAMGIFSLEYLNPKAAYYLKSSRVFTADFQSVK